MATSAGFDLSELTSSGRRAILAHAWPDVWAETLNLKIDGHFWGLAGREYLREIYRDPGQEIVVRKAAQLGFTVAMLVRTLHRVIEWKWNGLYLLPTKIGVIPFVQGRIDPMIDNCPQIRAVFNNVDSVTHKQTASNNNLYFRGTTVQTDLREVPVDFEIWDERDKMMASNLPLARTRMDGSPHKHLVSLSTPTAADWGVDRVYKDSDQREWNIRCLHCGHWQFVSWHENVVIGDTDHPDNCCATSYVHCSKCHKPWSHPEIIEMGKTGQWVALYPGRSIHGYYINQLTSPTKPLSELIRVWYDGEIRGDVDQLRELYNSALGLAWSAPGDRLTPEILDAARIPGWTMPTVSGFDATRCYSLGIDVGKDLHLVAIDNTTQDSKRVVDIRMENWNTLREILIGLQMRRITWTAVMDANPEKTLAEELAGMFPNNLWLAYYHDPRTMSKLAEWYPPDLRSGKAYASVRIDRTMAIDTAHNWVSQGMLGLPANARHLLRPGPEYGDFYSQLCAQAAITQPDAMGNPRRIYVHQDSQPDHFDHALTYAAVASMLIPNRPMPPEHLGVRDLPGGTDILDEVNSLFVQDPDGWSDY